MSNLTTGPLPHHFIWASGIEDTFVPQTRAGHRALDEYELMGHYEHWREDLAPARALGVQALRWGVPWYRVEPQQGTFDWRWIDQVLPYLVEELGITPIIDLMHYGCPFWLKREFANEAYPEAVAAYAAAFARRYHGLVRWYTPLNEALINAFMCGRRGIWPPYLRGETGYVRIMLQLIKGIAKTVTAIRQIDPDAVMVHVEAAALNRAAVPELEALAEQDQYQQYLSYDLLTGRVTPAHPLFSWLVRNGANPADLDAIASAPVHIDIMGLNFYPQWATKQLYINKQGRLAYRIIEKEGTGFSSLLENYYRRYGLPIMVTETSAKGSQKVRADWLDTSLAAIKQLRGQGVPVLGYTWFPLFTMIDWKYRLGRKPIAAYRLELGLYTLSHGDDGQRWRSTLLAERFCHYVTNPEEAVGSLSSKGVTAGEKKV